MTIKHSTARGFTLLELMLTIAIISILAVVSYGSYQRYFARADTVDLALRIDAIRTAFAVLDAEEGGIPSFVDPKNPGVIPPELSRLALSDDILQYPNIYMHINSGMFNQGSRPYVLIVDTIYDVNDSTLIALSEILAPGQFAWIAEPIIGIVPVIGTMNVLGNKHLAPITSPVPAPNPTSSSKFNIVPNP